MKNIRLKLILITVVILLLIPLVAMQFTEEVNWTSLHFIDAGTLLLGTGLVFDYIMRKVKTIPYQILFSVVLLIALLLIWAELAVGIF